MEQVMWAIGIVAVAMVLLCVRVIMKQNGRFSSQHISQNRKMRERGIHCAMTQHREAQKEAERKIDVKQL